MHTNVDSLQESNPQPLSQGSLPTQLRGPSNYKYHGGEFVVPLNIASSEYKYECIYSGMLVQQYCAVRFPLSIERAVVDPCAGAGPGRRDSFAVPRTSADADRSIWSPFEYRTEGGY